MALVGPDKIEIKSARGALFIPVIGLATVAAGPLLLTIWESLHLHDLRMPWLGRPFVGGANYVAAWNDAYRRAATAIKQGLDRMRQWANKLANQPAAGNAD